MRRVRISEFQNFNQILELYMESLKILSDSKGTSFKTTRLENLSNPEYKFSYVTMTIINEFTKIEEIYENSDFNEERWNKMFVSGDMLPPFSDIKVKGVPEDDNTLEGFKEKLRHIRNCIAHGRFYLEFEDKQGTSDSMKDTCIVFDDPEKNVEGRIPFFGILNLSHRFYFSKTKYGDGFFECDTNGITVKDPTKFLSEALRKAKIVNFKTREKRLLSPEEKTRIKNFSAILGKGEMKSNILRYHQAMKRPKSRHDVMLSQTFSKMIDRIIYPRTSVFNSSDLDNYNMFIANLYSYDNEDLNQSLASKLTSPSEAEIDNENLKLLYEAVYYGILSTVSLKDTRDIEFKKAYMTRPLLYNEGIISMMNYLTGYIRENNINYGRTIFKFQNIDISGIKIDVEDPEEPCVIELNPGEKKAKEIEELEKQKQYKKNDIKELIKKNISKKGNLTSLLKILESKNVEEIGALKREMTELKDFLTTLRDEGIEGKDVSQIEDKIHEYIVFLETCVIPNSTCPAAIINNIKNSLQELKPLPRELQSLDSKIAKEKVEYERVKDEETYVDTSGFFGHIRNAITHSHVVPNYEKAAKTRKIEDIEYTFTDYKKDCPTWVTFKATISGRELIKLAQAVQASINRQVEESDHNKKFENLFLKEAILAHGITMEETQNKEAEERREENDEPNKGTNQQTGSRND